MSYGYGSSVMFTDLYKLSKIAALNERPTYKGTKQLTSGHVPQTVHQSTDNCVLSQSHTSLNCLRTFSFSSFNHSLNSSLFWK
jgi:hypothetical protein